MQAEFGVPVEQVAIVTNFHTVWSKHNEAGRKCTGRKFYYL